MKKYNDDYYKLTYHKYPVRPSGFESKERKIYSRDVNEDKLDNNLIRAKMKVFEYAMCNEFSHFVTLTLDKNKYDRYNLKKYVKDLGQFIRDYRKKYKVDIQYLLIPEEHEDGAWHMHGLIKGIPSNHLEKNKNGYLDWKAYSSKFGYMSIDSIRCMEAVSKYITKYITKTIKTGKGVTEKNQKLYYVSRGLKTAVKVKEGSINESDLTNISFDYENDYIKFKKLNGLQYLKFEHTL